MSGLLQDIWTGMLAATPLEQSATILGVLGVWLMIRQSLWAFPVGLVQVLLSAIVFHQYRLYADRNLQAVFFAVLAYGWWHWVRGERTQGEGAQVGVLGLPSRLACLGVGLLASAVWGWYQARFTDAAMPYRDAFISSFSILAQWLQSRRKLENWHGWILVNATAVPVYWIVGMRWFAVLYFLFLLMALGGLREWHADQRRRKGAAS